MIQLNRISWDSDFFGINIAECCFENSNETLDASKSDFDLIVVKTEGNDFLDIEGYLLNFSETKITYSKPVNYSISKENDASVFDFDFDPINESDLFELAFESGKYSRFYLDSNFSTDAFRNLYKAWVTNSLNKKLATKIYYTRHDNVVTGFVTLKQNKLSAQIGLIGVRPEYQGQKIGSKLLNAVEFYCKENEINNLIVETQKKNQLACKFYEKNSFEVNATLKIAHFWKAN